MLSYCGCNPSVVAGDWAPLPWYPFPVGENTGRLKFGCMRPDCPGVFIDVYVYDELPGRDQLPWGLYEVMLACELCELPLLIPAESGLKLSVPVTPGVGVSSSSFSINGGYIACSEERFLLNPGWGKSKWWKHCKYGNILLGTWCISKGRLGGGSWKWGRLPAAGLRDEKLCVAVSMPISSLDDLDFPKHLYLLPT